MTVGVGRSGGKGDPSPVNRKAYEVDVNCETEAILYEWRRTTSTRGHLNAILVVLVAESPQQRSTCETFETGMRKGLVAGGVGRGARGAERVVQVSYAYMYSRRVRLGRVILLWHRHVRDMLAALPSTERATWPLIKMKSSA